MGSLVAPIGEDGKLQTRSTSGDSLSSKSKKDNSTIDSDMFLSLLVAEMQNQDPLSDKQYRMGITVCNLYTGSEDE